MRTCCFFCYCCHSQRNYLSKQVVLEENKVDYRVDYNLNKWILKMDNWICLQSWGLYVFSIAFFFAVFVISVLLIKAMLIPSLQLFSLPGHINSSRLKTDLTGSNYHNTTNKDKQNKPKEGGLSNQAAMLISAD